MSIQERRTTGDTGMQTKPADAGKGVKIDVPALSAFNGGRELGMSAPSLDLPTTNGVPTGPFAHSESGADSSTLLPKMVPSGRSLLPDFIVAGTDAELQQPKSVLAGLSSVETSKPKLLEIQMKMVVVGESTVLDAPGVAKPQPADAAPAIGAHVSVQESRATPLTPAITTDATQARGEQATVRVVVAPAPSGDADGVQVKVQVPPAAPKQVINAPVRELEQPPGVI